MPLFGKQGREFGEADDSKDPVREDEPERPGEVPESLIEEGPDQAQKVASCAVAGTVPISEICEGDDETGDQDEGSQDEGGQADEDEDGDVEEDDLETGRRKVEDWDPEAVQEVETAARGLAEAFKLALAATFTAEVFTPVYDGSTTHSFGGILGELGEPTARMVNGNLIQWGVGKAVSWGLQAGAGMPPLMADLAGRTVTAFLTEKHEKQVVQVEHLMDATLAVHIGLYAARGDVLECPALYFLAQAKTSKQVTSEIKKYIDGLEGHGRS